ncbi:MAG: hypothetical protein AUG51_07755 [Acidobacteria bacterium 13_1_20CM_3_53_8]|nr:MAG: hypothetical protein AUG51_07755 [Acidobacteria bacterium 13_1_20CM_3_53_8]
MQKGDMAQAKAIGQRLVDGHAVDPTAKRKARLARSFKKDDRLEAIIKLRFEDPKAYEQLPVSVKVAVGHYLTAKAANEEMGAK